MYNNIMEWKSFDSSTLIIREEKNDGRSIN